jgi:hypothetical protein
VKHHSRKITINPAAGTGWEAVQRQLESAAEEARRAAISGKRHGILVTRHRQDTFTVALSPEVPYGMTHEREDRTAAR